MREAANMLQIKNFGRNKLIAVLKDQGILSPNNLPHIDYIVNGCFSFNNKLVRGGRYGKQNIAHVPLISDNGIELVKDLIKNINV